MKFYCYICYSDDTFTFWGALKHKWNHFRCVHEWGNDSQLRGAHYRSCLKCSALVQHCYCERLAGEEIRDRCEILRTLDLYPYGKEEILTREEFKNTQR